LPSIINPHTRGSKILNNLITLIKEMGQVVKVK
jgi:hypothetical protein